MPLRRLAFLVSIALACSVQPSIAGPEPEAGHVRLEANVSRLQVNDYATRWQFKLRVAATAPELTDLEGLDKATLRLYNPVGRYVELLPRAASEYPRRFKAANVRLEYRAVEDSRDQRVSNLPAGFCAYSGPYRFSAMLAGQLYWGEFNFGDPLQMTAEQLVNDSYLPVDSFCIQSGAPLRVATVPAAFGPVYYKRQDPRNFIYQLANMEASLQSGSYHPEVESPMYTLQVRAGDATGETDLLDPSHYIQGHQPHLIRSDWTTTPLQIAPADFAGRKALVVDFFRTDTPEPNAGFHGPTSQTDGWSGQMWLSDRVLYALYVDEPPAAADLGQQTGSALAEEEQAQQP